MIGYPIDLQSLEDVIEAESPGWLERASARTARFRQLGRYEEASSIWGEVKRVYMRLQGNCKCAYCERKLESTDFGAVEQDVEHFRPKGSVRKWPSPKALNDEGVVITDPSGLSGGDYLLPYHPFNYAAACKPCNSTLKKDYFPISGSYDTDGEDPVALVAEQPLLVYPIGPHDTSPEVLIEFYGVTPRARQSGAAGKPSDYERHRALVTIAFFRLADPVGRKNLFRERALIIIALFPCLQSLASAGSEDQREDSRRVVDAFLRDEMQHANCARRFRRLFDADPQAAGEAYRAALKLVTSIS